ncbi:MAG: glutamate--tRNA ligase family protein, partial [Gemmataceae bacterium]
RQAGLVFPCTCTRSDLERATSAPHAEHEGPAYPGTCSARSAQDAEFLTGFAWRFRLPPRIVPFTDGFCGTVQVDLHRVGGDFVIWKNTDAPAYQLAVAVDDAAMGITQVVRGDDLVPSTPRQLLLYEALHLEEPSFFHVPLVVGTDGRRLAKRHGDTRLSSLREAGVTAERVVGLLAWSCGWSEPNREWSARDLLKRFEMDSIPREPFVLGPEHLRAIGYPA